MLAVVEDEQDGPAAQVIDEDLERRAVRIATQVEDREQDLGDEVGGSDGRQLREPDTVRELVQALCRDLQAEAGLAGAAGAGERDEAIRGEQALELCHL